MANKNGGFIGTDGLDAPDSPTGVTVSGGIDGVASISFTAPTDTGTSDITGFVATSSNGVGATGTSSPISVTGLTLGTAATFRAYAVNAYGTSAASDATNSITPAASRGAWSGGDNASNQRVNTIDYISISTTGNASDFGDTSVAHNQGAAASSSTRGVIQLADTNVGRTNVLEYVTIASTGNTTDFGDTSQTRSGIAANANSTIGVFYGGTTGSATARMDSITIASTGNASNFGSATVANSYCANGVCSSGTRGVFAHGETNVMDYITFASLGEASDFGDSTVSTYGSGAVSSNTRGVFAGGDGQNVIDYITIASTGNATDFGDLNHSNSGKAGVCNNTRGCLGGGTQSTTNIIDYITIASTGNAQDFGDLTVARGFHAGGIANGHGGLQ